MQNLLPSWDVIQTAPPPLALLAVFIGGVLAGFTPCVYPMLPIISSYVGARSIGAGFSRWGAFGLSFSYVLGMALVYTALGMIAAFTGRLFGEFSSSFVAQLVVANLLILFALHLLEALPFPNLPLFSGLGRWTQAGGVFGAFLLGAGSGLVASPCTAPLLAGLLTYAATSQNVLWGGGLLFAFSLGMGSLLLLAGTFSGLLARLPRSGPWMVRIKKILGLALLGLGEYFLLRAGQLWW